MKDIIQQIAVRMVERVLESLQNEGIRSIGEAVRRIQPVANEAVLEIVSAAIEQIDAAVIAASRERKLDGLRIQQRDVPRTVLTELGELRYTRTYFETADGEYCYPTDALIGVSAYERLTKELCATLVQQASVTSMDKAAKNVGVTVSRQTVNNKVLALRQVATEAERVADTPKELHLFADEDHVHLHSGRSAIVPLVTVTEGIDSTSKRHKTINAVHFEGYGMDNGAFLENISAFLCEKYDMEQVKQIYLHGDGGTWIKRAKDVFPDVNCVMDGFHLQKWLRKLSHLKGVSPYMGAIYKSIREDDFATFVDYCARIDQQQDEIGHAQLKEQVNFIQNHWEAIVKRMQNEVCGSCTEPLVSHVLSERLSRNPLAWSEDGLRQMAMLRVYTQNGGVVTAKDIRVSRSKAERSSDKAALYDGFARYRQYADKQIDAFLNAKRDWSIFETPSLRFGKLDGTGMLLAAFGRDHGILPSA